MAISSTRLDPNSAAEKAVSAIGLGYDLCNDIRLSSCKLGPLESNPRLIELDSNQTRDLVFPGGVVVPTVPTSIKCDKCERTRFRSDVLSFSQFYVTGHYEWLRNHQICFRLNTMFN
ncbi:MACPF domain-containing protein [Quillaja saponaria]|uniref:MACPF domain-containing protein n=1 Tax=Quillaja saponaria TaxID=32244 RepID=A0AAD7KW69_QUISA|nr:MACPF domain-containing protein [Quillaja saponaria]